MKSKIDPSRILKLRWSKKEKDLECCYPSKRDSNFLFSLFPESIIKEFQGRGYDITTLKFQIRKRLVKIDNIERILEKNEKQD